MRTLLLIALIALGTNVLEPLLGPLAQVCAQPCPDDDEAGRCTPDCTDYTCCGHRTPGMALMPATSGLSFLMQSHEVHALPLPLPPDDPDGRAVRHVPKDALLS